MNGFDRARQKYERLKEKKQEALPKEDVKEEWVAVEVGGCAPPIGVLKEKADNSAVIDVTVRLPSGSFAYRFVKPAVFQNATPAKLTKNGFRNCFVEGLRPLLGGVNELPVSGNEGSPG